MFAQAAARRAEWACRMGLPNGRGGRCWPAAIESAFALAFQKRFERLIVFFGVMGNRLKRG